MNLDEEWWQEINSQTPVKAAEKGLACVLAEIQYEIFRNIISLVSTTSPSLVTWILCSASVAY
jgi:hypothetical protein